MHIFRSYPQDELVYVSCYSKAGAEHIFTSPAQSALARLCKLVRVGCTSKRLFDAVAPGRLFGAIAGVMRRCHCSLACATALEGFHSYTSGNGNDQVHMPPLS